MRWRTRHIGLGVVVLLVSSPAQSPQPPSACCYTPARGPDCPRVRFGWGDCPGSKKACDWCYGPSGVFAYAPRGSVYTLSSGCNNLGANTTWATRSSQTAMLMTNAGGNCSADGKGGYLCSNVDAGRFKQAGNCGGQRTQPSPAPQTSYPGPCACDTPARGAKCPPVRFGWGNCPGNRQACDWCYGPSGVFAYSPRGSVYTLSSGCNNLGANTTWATKSSQAAMLMTQAGGNCSNDGKGGYLCSNVDPGKYRQAANCGK